jgi:hypothetical protein
VRSAWYSLRPGGWRDYVTLLHPPYTAWHLSYVAIGAALAPRWRPDRMGWTLLAFGLAMGIGAHALDELRGRPLATRIPHPGLWTLAALSIGTAIAIGVVTAHRWTPWLYPAVAIGGFLVVAYNLELFGGRFHNDAAFALMWGAFPLLTAYLACAERLDASALVAALFAALLSHAQRRLSTPVRELRRRAHDVPVEARAAAIEPLEAGLRLLSAATVALAVALVLARVRSGAG